MSLDTQYHTIKTAIRTGLAARAGLTGVAVSSAYLGDSTPPESVQLTGPDQIAGDWALLGKQSRNEDLTLEGLVWVVKPGADETTIQAARARAVALLQEVVEFITGDTSIGGRVKSVNIIPGRVVEHANPDGRTVQIDFTITTANRLTLT